MTNHLHFLVRVGEAPLGHLMRQIGSEYARAFQLSIATTGHLFENRYHATLIDTDAYLLEVVRYIHQNPVRAQLVPDVAHYRWSSHANYLGAGDTTWVTTEFALAMFSHDRARAVALYRAFVDSLAPANIAEELASLDRGAPLLGNPEFIKQHAPARRELPSLESIIADACDHFGVTHDELRSPSRSARLVVARAWIAHRATRNGLLPLSVVARELCRDQSTLRSAMQKYADSLTTEAAELSLLSPPGTTKASKP
jgi:hypothetical protein